MIDIAIRPGTVADLDRIMEIANESEAAPHWRPSQYDQIFKTDRFLIVAEIGTAIVGFLVAHDIAGEWELENVVVEQSHQRRGIARELVKALLGAAEGKAMAIHLEVRESNMAARKLYLSCGFQPSGRRKDYYSNPGEDAILYRFLCSPATLENC